MRILCAPDGLFAWSESLVAGLKAMAPALEEVANQGGRFGLDAETLHHLHPGILARAQELADLT